MGVGGLTRATSVAARRAVLGVGLIALVGFLAIVGAGTSLGQAVKQAAPDLANGQTAQAVYPAAVLPFTERGVNVRQYGAQVADILFAELSKAPGLQLVERTELEKARRELELGLSGAVDPGTAAQVGRLTGAKLLISGSVLQSGESLYLVAKVIGTETGRVVGISVKGRARDDLAKLAEQLAAEIVEAVKKQGEEIAPKAPTGADRLAELKRKLPDGKRPSLRVRITERHVGQPTIDPAAETEIAKFCRATGFGLVDPEHGSEGEADVVVTGEAFSEFAGRHGDLISVKARVEVKAVDRKTGKVLAVDRQTAVAVDLAEQVAGKTALQEAAASIAGRLLPKIAGPGKD